MWLKMRNYERQWPSAVREQNIKRPLKSPARRLRKVILFLYPALLRPHVECWLQFWTLQYKRHMEIKERVQKRVTDMMKGWEHPSYEGRWTAGTVQPGEGKV